MHVCNEEHVLELSMCEGWLIPHSFSLVTWYSLSCTVAKQCSVFTDHTKTMGGFVTEHWTLAVSPYSSLHWKTFGLKWPTPVANCHGNCNSIVGYYNPSFCRVSLHCREVIYIPGGSLVFRGSWLVTTMKDRHSSVGNSMKVWNSINGLGQLVSAHTWSGTEGRIVWCLGSILSRTCHLPSPLLDWESEKGRPTRDMYQENKRWPPLALRRALTSKLAPEQLPWIMAKRTTSE
jgi:hypothetical protein